MNQPIRERFDYGFLEFVQIVENRELFENGTNIVHESPEGGTDTWGFGHKLDLVEQSTRQLKNGTPLEEGTKEDAYHVLIQDLVAAEKRTAHAIGPKFDSLGRREREMLVDYSFNLGNVTRSFPKFTAAILAGDIEGQRKEYQRFFTNAKGNIRPLEERNKLFYDRYLSDEALEKWANGEI